MPSPIPPRPATATLKKPLSALPERLGGGGSWLETLRRPAGWRVAVITITLLAIVVRVLIIAHTRGGSNLRIYTYFARLALHGGNPFNPPAHGAVATIYANSPPLEFGVFAALLGVHDSPTTLRLLFLLGDVAVLLLVGFCFPRPLRWRLGFLLFYAFNPFVLLAWTVYAQDKTLLFFGIAVLILALERGREWIAWSAFTALAVFKFLGTFAAPALALHWFRKRGWWALAPIGAFLLVLALSNLPWFPKSLDAFARRDRLLSIGPDHVAPTLLLVKAGLYAPVEAKLLPAALAIVVLVLFYAGRIDIREAVVWSLFAGYVFLPDDDFDRLLLIILPFFLLLDFSAGRWIVVWALSTVEALAGSVATRGVPHELSSVAGALRAVFSHEGTLRSVLWLNLLGVLVLAYYFIDRRAGRAPVGRVEP